VSLARRGSLVLVKRISAMNGDSDLLTFLQTNETHAIERTARRPAERQVSGNGRMA
jgi:hypothetical protein